MIAINCTLNQLTLDSENTPTTISVTTVEEGEALLASASKFAIWLCACPYQLRNLPAVRQLRNIIMDKKYGAVKSLEVYSDPRYSFIKTLFMGSETFYGSR